MRKLLLALALVVPVLAQWDGPVTKGPITDPQTFVWTLLHDDAWCAMVSSVIGDNQPCQRGIELYLTTTSDQVIGYNVSVYWTDPTGQEASATRRIDRWLEVPTFTTLAFFPFEGECYKIEMQVILRGAKMTINRSDFHKRLVCHEGSCIAFQAPR